MIRFKNLLSLSLLVVVVSNITALARPNAGYNGYRQKLLKTTGAAFACEVARNVCSCQTTPQRLYS